MEGGLMSVIKSRKAKLVYCILIFIGSMFFCSFTAVKFSEKTSKFEPVKVVTDVLWQLSDQYLAPKFDEVNQRLDNLQVEIEKTNAWTAKKDDESYKSLVALIDKQYEKYNKDRFDIKITDLKTIDDSWASLPDSYKTSMVTKEYDIAMAYYLTVK